MIPLTYFRCYTIFGIKCWTHRDKKKYSIKASVQETYQFGNRKLYYPTYLECIPNWRAQPSPKTQIRSKLLEDRIGIRVGKQRAIPSITSMAHFN